MLVARATRAALPRLTRRFFASQPLTMSHAQSPFAPIQPGPYGNLSSFVMSGMPIGDGDGASTLAFEDAITGETRTRGELRDTALSVALSLRQKYGLREGDRLCLYSPNHVDYPAVMLACGLLGVTLTPANPLYTQEELQRQVDGSGSKIIVSHPLCKPVAELMGKPVVYFGEPSFEDLTKQANLPEAAAAFPEPAAGNDSLCCLPYSSGTTGLPKGTMLSHDNLIANLLQMDACEGPFVDPKADVLMSPLPMFHIYGFLASVLYSVWRGLPVVTMSKFDLEVFCSAVEKRKCTRGHIVPPIILGLAKHPIVSKYDMSSFKVVISAAAPLTADIETECASRLGCIVKQAWGMSELSPIGTFTPDNGLKPGSGTIGVVCGSTEGKIVDIESRETLAVGEEGELMIKGPQVMQG